MEDIEKELKDEIKEKDKKIEDLEISLRETLGYLESLKQNKERERFNGNSSLSLVEIDKVIFLVDHGRKLVKDMNPEDKRILRLKMEVAEKRIRTINYGIYLEILEEEERATEEERENLKKLDKQYDGKKRTEESVRKVESSQNPYEKTVKILMSLNPKLTEEKARELARNTIINAREGKK